MIYVIKAFLNKDRSQVYDLYKLTEVYIPNRDFLPIMIRQSNSFLSDNIYVKS